MRDRILDAALAVLSESGLQRFTQVEVATRAGVRQSHLTYYFPTRDDLLAAVTEVAVDAIGSGVRDLVGQEGADGSERWLEQLAESVCGLEHMRMFLAMIVEADGDPVLRKMMVEATRRMEGVIAEALGGRESLERARLLLATVWGLGLYLFLMRPKSRRSWSGYASWLARMSEHTLTAQAGER